jgi:hypothetical protein
VLNQYHTVAIAGAPSRCIAYASALSMPRRY